MDLFIFLLFLCSMKGSFTFITSRFNKISKQISRIKLSSIADLRKEYSRKGLDESDLPAAPLDLFRMWFNEACAAKVIEPNAMCLSTCKDNIPSARFVLLKAYDASGFVWYTNFESRKGSELKVNPNAALTFWWGDLERSIRIEGRAEQVLDDEANEYFSSRPRSSQIGALTSSQSREIESRQALEAQEVETMRKYSDSDAVIPRPAHWGGYRLVPSRLEFWKGRESRLHDRIVFLRKQEVGGRETNMQDPLQWESLRLQP